MKIRGINVVWRKLAHGWGYAYTDEKRIELDPRMDDKTLLDIAPHEFAHMYFPGAPEALVSEFGKAVGAFLWKVGFRRETEGSE